MLRPRSLAIVGGKHACRSIVQCERLGFEGEIWPVNPNRSEMEGRKCFSTLDDLPGVPDAAFLAVARAVTIESVKHLQNMGAGGAVCYASGFAEEGVSGDQYQRELEDAMGNMPLIGPNCHGLLNYQDGVALWPEEQGGRRCREGVAIISQSGNIALNLSMQRRGLSVAYLISTGNMASIKTHQYIRTFLANSNITAIGLYLEQIDEPEALSEAAIEALRKKIPIVVLESGHSELGANLTKSHSHSMSGDALLNRAFYEKYGLIQVDSIPQLLETLKFVSMLEPSSSNTLSSISCSGGEAALMADIGETFGLAFPQFGLQQKSRLRQVLGDRVTISNPLDYHTYIWGNESAQKECFEAVFSGSQATNVVVLDYPTEHLCDTSEWDVTVRAAADAKQRTDARVAIVSTIHENLPQNGQQLICDAGIVPMLGMEECLRAVAGSMIFARKSEESSSLRPLFSGLASSDCSIILSEIDAKAILKKAGVPTVEGMLISNEDQLINAAEKLGFPLVAKISSVEIMHKSEVGGVILNIGNATSLHQAFDSLTKISRKILVERMSPEPVLEFLVGVRKHVQFGYVVVIGAGGKWTELISDSRILLPPLSKAEIRNALSELKIGKMFDGYRGVSADADGLISVVMRLIRLIQNHSELSEVEINPLFVYERGPGVIAVDAVATVEQPNKESKHNAP